MMKEKMTLAQMSITAYAQTSKETEKEAKPEENTQMS